MTPDPVARARSLVADATQWTPEGRLATLHWWSDPGLLAGIGAGLAALHPDARPTLIAGVQSSGYLLAPLVAVELGAGMLGIQKLSHDGGITLATARGCPAAEDRVLLVDDVLETGAQAAAVKQLVISAGATWLGVAALVGYREAPDLGLRFLWDVEELHRHTDTAR